MASNNEHNDREEPTHSRGKEFKSGDLLEYSNIFASEFDNSELHDRILVLEVMEEGDDVIFPDVKGNEESVIALEDNEEKEAIQGDGRTNGSIEEKEKETHLPQLDNENSKLPTNISKTKIIENAEMVADEARLSEPHDTNTELLSDLIETKNTQTPEEAQKSERGSLTKEISSKQYRLFIHSSWLAVHSRYFRALFYSSGMKETFTKEIILKVTEEELEAHYTLIKAMYQPSILDDTHPHVVLQVLTLANKYDVRLIFKKCKYTLMSVTMSVDLCESVLAVANEMVAVHDLIEYLEKFLVNAFKPLDKVWRTDEFKNLSEVSLRMLLSSAELAVLSENTVFVALMAWCKYNDYNGPSLLSLLRPELMTVEFLQEVVYNHYQAKQMVGFNELLLNGFRYHCSSGKKRALLENRITRRDEYKNNDEPSFIWFFQIPENDQHDSPEIHKSEHFWWCGFEMMLSLTIQSDLCSVCLYVLNIEDVSSLNFVWVIEAGLFPTIIRRQVTFRNRFDLGYDKTEFPFPQPIQRNTRRYIKIFIRFAISSSLNPVPGQFDSISDDNEAGLSPRQ